VLVQHSKCTDGRVCCRLAAQPVQPRLVRVRSGADAVDADYMLDLGELFDTPAVNGLWPLANKKFVVQVWRGPDEVGEDELDVKPNWEWHIVDAETRESSAIEALGRSTTSYSLLRFVVDGKLYLQQYVIENEDYNDAHVELYRVYTDASVEKVVETRPLTGQGRATVRSA
jgi:hypothetical protein